MISGLRPTLEPDPAHDRAEDPIQKIAEQAACSMQDQVIYIKQPVRSGVDEEEPGQLCRFDNE